MNYKSFTHLNRAYAGLFIFVFLVFCAATLQAQNEYNDFIIRLRGDTIKKPKILMKSPYPDKNEVTIQLRKRKTRSYRPSSIASFFHKNKYYESVIIRKPTREGRKPKRIFARKLVGGKVSLYISRDGDNNELYLQKGDELPKLLSWDKYMSTIERYLDDFKEFNEHMQLIGEEEVFYDEHSMVRYLSNYNAWREPEKYLPVELEFKEKTRLSVYGGVYTTFIKSLSSDPDFKVRNSFGKVGYTLGGNLFRQITKSYGINVGLALTNQSAEVNFGEGGSYSLVYRTVENPVYVSFEGFIKNTVKYYWDLGGVINYPVRGVGTDVDGGVFLLSTDVGIAPMASVGIGYRLRDDRLVRIYLRGTVYRQRILDLNPIPGSFLTNPDFRFFNLGLFGAWEF